MPVETHQFIEFSRPFIEASKKVFETMVFTKLEHQKPTIKKDKNSCGDISAVLGLNGTFTKKDAKFDFKAMFVISWPYETYVKVANAMLMENHTEYNKEISDTGGEIANMIVGNAKRDLNVIGYAANMAIPSIIEGKNHTITYPQNTSVILIPIHSAHGPMYMEICFDLTPAK